MKNTSKFWGIIAFTALTACLALGLALASCTNPTGNTPTTYTVTFDANGGDGTAPSPQKAEAGSGITIPNEGSLSKTGYTFGGWNTDPNGTGTNYSAGSPFAPTGDITLYANWYDPNATFYTVTFNINGGDGAVPSQQKVQAGSGITIPDGSGLSKTGYIFGGWNTDPNGTGYNYSAGYSYTPTGDSTLYARWYDANATLYTVTFNANGGNGTPPSEQIAQAGYNITIPDGSGLTKTGYTFGGWNTDPNGTGINYQNGESFTPTGDSTLYARWYDANATLYTVTFNANGGDGTPPSEQRAQDGYSITIPDGSGLTRTGYTFGGWNTNGYGTGINYQSGESFTPASDSTLYARWDAIYYTVTFAANDGVGTLPSEQTVQAGYSITIPDGSELWRTGFTFGGWNTDPNGTGINYQNGESFTPTGDNTLYARWYDASATHYIVTFNANDGDGTPPSDQTAQAGDSITIPDGSGLTRTGYAFGGWNTDRYGTGANFQSGEPFTPDSDITLYAKWDVVYYTVTFNANSGDGTPPSEQTVQASYSITIPYGSGLWRTGYTFGGWNTNDAGTGTNYQIEEPFTPDSDITLYAKWDAITYTVTFNANSGDGTPPSEQTVQAGYSITIPDGSGLSRTNYTFGGWNTDPYGTGTNYQYDESFTPDSDITLYAKWDAIYYTVTFAANSGDGTPPSEQIVQAGYSTTLPDGNYLTKSNYTFGGWNTDESGTGDNYQSGESFTPDNDITLYAKWDVITHTVSPDRIEYYWVNEHGSLVTTSNGAATVLQGETLTIAPEGSGYVVKYWYLDGVNTGQSGNTYTFSSRTTGKHTVSLFVEKDSKLYNTTITIMVGTVQQFTVSFNANNATSGTAPSAITVNAGSSITLPDQGSLSRTGYTFGGWSTSGGGTNYNAGASYTVNSNTILYANWISGTAANGTEANPISLTVDTWTNGSITSTASGSAVWYSFYAYSGTTYYIVWNDTDNSGGTLDVRVAAYYSSGSNIFDVDNPSSNTRSFTASSTGTVKIKVYPFSSGGTGTFAVGYYY